MATKNMDMRKRRTPNAIPRGEGPDEFAAELVAELEGPELLKTFLKLLLFRPLLLLFRPLLLFVLALLLNDMREFAEGMAEFMADTVVVAAEFIAPSAEFAAEFTVPSAEFMAVVRVLFIEFAALVKLDASDFVDAPILLALNIELILCIVKITNPLQWLEFVY